MPRYKVWVHTEGLYIDMVEADSPAEAGTMVGDKVRAGTLRPFFDRPSIAGIDIHRMGAKPNEPDPR
jgi:hypothetical protein